MCAEVFQPHQERQQTEHGCVSRVLGEYRASWNSSFRQLGVKIAQLVEHLFCDHEVAGWIMDMEGEGSPTVPSLRGSVAVLHAESSAVKNCFW